MVEVILYGSCVRGDYAEDSDIDIALLTKVNRLESKRYEDDLATIATEIAMKHFVIVNFVCLPFDEFEEKRLINQQITEHFMRRYESSSKSSLLSNFIVSRNASIYFSKFL